MSLLKNLTTESDVVEDKDSVGGGGNLRDSAVYPCTIKLAYLQKSEGGALGLFLKLTPEDGNDINASMYLTGGDSKGNKNYYINAKNEKHYLPGFNLANSLALVVTNKEISALADNTEQKVVGIYNFKEKKEIPQKVEVITELMGEKVNVALMRQLVDKTVKNEATGSYDPTGETREENEVDKFFSAQEKYLNMTATEIKAKEEKAVFIDQWNEKWAGKVRDKTTKNGPTAGAPRKAGAPAAAGGKPTTSLFGDD